MRPHKLNSFPEYMTKVVEHFRSGPSARHILDLPAGHGLLTDALRDIGHTVTSADINERRPDYVYSNMNERLPFDEESFDGVVCLEGLEHMLNPFQLIGELLRVTRVGGQVVISTPNVMNMFSRLQFLLTGTFYQFHPAQLHDIAPDEPRDRFHIAPMTYHQIRYLGDYFGARVASVDGDAMKRRYLLPLFSLILLLGKPWSWKLFFSRRYREYRERNQQIHDHINSWPVLFGRSIIVVLEKTKPTHFAAPHLGSGKAAA